MYQAFKWVYISTTGFFLHCETRGNTGCIISRFFWPNWQMCSLTFKVPVYQCSVTDGSGEGIKLGRRKVTFRISWGQKIQTNSYGKKDLIDCCLIEQVFREAIGAKCEKTDIRTTLICRQARLEDFIKWGQRFKGTRIFQKKEQEITSEG